MKKQLTIRQQLNKLPFPYNVMAIEEYRKTSFGILKVDTVREAVDMFSWERSDMGGAFWLGIYSNCYYENL